MKVFITGGAGFIGSWITEKLVANGHQVTVYDNFSSGLHENLAAVKNKINIVEADIRDYEKLKESMKGHDMVNHQAAQLEITTAIDSPQMDVDVNIVGSLNVLRAMKENDIRKAVFASSACVYGNLNEYLVDEDVELHPNWEYGVSKLAVEKYCDIFALYEGMNIASLRYSIVYGVREWYGRVLTIFMKRATEDKDFILFDKGDNVRDFVYVEDVADLSILLTENNWYGHVVLNASSGKATSTEVLSRKIQSAVKEQQDKEVNVIYENIAEGEFSKHVEGRKRLPRELNIMSLNNAKAKSLFGWQPSVDLKEGIRREYKWISNAPDTWKRMSY
jgi:UDP-glucose 4-epimerase